MPPVKANRGFTLIEVMLVIVVVGLMISAIQFTFSTNKAEEELQKESTRFAGIFDLVSQYGLLNNIELGLVVEQNAYQFVGFDGTKWTEISDQGYMQLYSLPENMTISISFDELPVEESLINRALFIIEDEDDFTLDTKEEEKPIQPQVFILSGGEITPFIVLFEWNDKVNLDEDIAYRVIGEYSTPLTVQGPIIDGEYSDER